jgi:hypothetical protein
MGGGNFCFTTYTTIDSIWIFDKSAFPCLAMLSTAKNSTETFSSPSENGLPGCFRSADKIQFDGQNLHFGGFGRTA